MSRPTSPKTLYEAAIEGDIKTVEELIEAGVDVDTKDREGYTVLGRVALQRSFQLKKYLKNTDTDVQHSIDWVDEHSSREGVIGRRRDDLEDAAKEVRRNLDVILDSFDPLLHEAFYSSDAELAHPSLISYTYAAQINVRAEQLKEGYDEYNKSEKEIGDRSVFKYKCDKDLDLMILACIGGSPAACNRDDDVELTKLRHYDLVAGALLKAGANYYALNNLGNSPAHYYTRLCEADSPKRTAYPAYPNLIEFKKSPRLSAFTKAALSHIAGKDPGMEEFGISKIKDVSEARPHDRIEISVPLDHQSLLGATVLQEMANADDDPKIAMKPCADHKLRGGTPTRLVYTLNSKQVGKFLETLQQRVIERSKTHEAVGKAGDGGLGAGSGGREEGLKGDGAEVVGGGGGPDASPRAIKGECVVVGAASCVGKGGR